MDELRTMRDANNRDLQRDNDLLREILKLADGQVLASGPGSHYVYRLTWNNVHMVHDFYVPVTLYNLPLEDAKITRVTATGEVSEPASPIQLWLSSQ